MSFLAVDMFDDHVFPATAAQTLLCKASRMRKEVGTNGASDSFTFQTVFISRLWFKVTLSAVNVYIV